MNLNELLSLIGSGAEYRPEDVRFYSSGLTVGVTTGNTNATWCVIETTHRTDVARRLAETRARYTAKALNRFIYGLIEEESIANAQA